MKYCSKCLLQKEFVSFYRYPNYRDGYSSWCKDCKKKYIAQQQNEPSQIKVKRCSACNLEKEVINFHKDRRIVDGYSCRCKACKFAVGRNSRLKQKYSLDESKYDELLKSQDNRCAICQTTQYRKNQNAHFAVDHDHKTGLVRGLLCDTCNRGLGYFKDNIDLLKSAERYLQQSPNKIEE